MDAAPPPDDTGSRFETKLRAAEADLARLRGAREAMVAAGALAREVAAELSAETVSDTSDDGVATVACDGRGKVSAVVLDTAGYNGVTEKQLCASVLQARKRARDRARQAAASAAPHDGVGASGE